MCQSLDFAYIEVIDVQQKLYFYILVECMRQCIIIESFHATFSCIDTNLPNDVALNSRFQGLHDNFAIPMIVIIIIIIHLKQILVFFPDKCGRIYISQHYNSTGLRK